MVLTGGASVENWKHCVSALRYHSVSIEVDIATASRSMSKLFYNFKIMIKLAARGHPFYIPFSGRFFLIVADFLHEKRTTIHPHFIGIFLNHFIFAQTMKKNYAGLRRISFYASTLIPWQTKIGPSMGPTRIFPVRLALNIKFLRSFAVVKFLPSQPQSRKERFLRALK